MSDLTAPEVAHPGDNRPSVYREGDLLVVRASSLGHCLWELIAFGQGHEPQPLPERLLEVFAEGHAAEPKVLARLAELGWRLDGAASQREGNLRVGGNRVVRYHPDAIADIPIDGERRVVEVKKLAHSTFEKARLHGVESTYKDYDWQLSTMMIGEDLPGVWVVLDKETGELHYQFVDTPIRSYAEIVRRVKAIADGVDGADITSIDRACDEPNQYPCRFIHLRPEPERVEADVVELSQADEVAWTAAAAEYEHWRKQQSEAKAAMEECRKVLLEIARQGRGDDEPTPTVIHGGHRVGWKTSPRTKTDLAAMVADGIDVAKYQTTSTSESIDVGVI